jgi:S-adenosyl-L-methionine methyltransferase
MSRLDSHIRQKIAQRDAIDLAARRLGDREGLIVEFGLGTGRSYSHLAERFPSREIFCFDRRDVAHPRSRPPADHFYIGELLAVLADPTLHHRFAGRVMLLHLDLGSGGPEDETVPELVVERTHGWLAPGAVVLSDQELTLATAWCLDAVDTRGQLQHADRYHVYRRPEG